MSLYQNLLVDAVGLGADELTAIKTWMQQLLPSKSRSSVNQSQEPGFRIICLQS
ncbi:hypothetical protein [Nostoc sp.]|uniref:hypothetical protein n=1 Tax=Nostoc sp. TaxID=1180 RepID=UPI002FF4AB90